MQQHSRTISHAIKVRRLIVRIRSIGLVLTSAYLAALMTDQSIAGTVAKATVTSWDSLIPLTERAHYQPGPPPPQHDYLGGESGLAALQPQDDSVNPELNNQLIRIAGFIVPLDIDNKGDAIEFFLVPYYGACIHVPPPAPNQMIDVHYPHGLRLDSLAAAYWINGRIKIGAVKSKLGASVYSMDATQIDRYHY